MYNRDMWNRAVVEIDLEAIRNNIRSVRYLAGNKRGIWAAVKANAYGHGAIPVSRACIEAGVNGLCVATIEEACELRQAGFELPVLILGCISTADAGDAINMGLHCTLCDIHLASELSKVAVSTGKIASVHLKIDTGMGRIGVFEQEMLDFAQAVSMLPGMHITGLFTHFPSADEIDRTFTLNQIRMLRGVAQSLEDAGIQVPIVHAANSAGILGYPESYFDAVRPGIMIYGQYPSVHTPKTVELAKTFTLKSRIAFLKNVDANTYISYGRTHTTKCKSKIATVSIGYGDGYPRALSNKGYAVVRGEQVPIVGRICMDQLMLDVTNVSEVHTGDEVILYGGGYDSLDAGLIADKLGTISYELFCNVSSRVPRIYINE